MRTIADWKRLGSETESIDRGAGHTAIGEAEISETLADFFEPDLSNPDITEQDGGAYRAALDALCDGYRNGG